MNLFKKTLILFVASALTVSVSYAQKVKGNGNLIKINRSVGQFDEVGVGGSFDVILKKGQEGKLEISVEENLQSYLVTEVKGGDLKIHWKKGTSVRTTKNTKVTVYFNSLNGVALAGSGDVSSSDLIKTDHMEVALAGSGDIELEVEANRVEAAISGSGDIVLNGKSEEFEGAIAGSGDLKASGLDTKKASMKISGSGGMSISVQEELFARISGSGDIKYKGNPRIEDIKVSGSGSVGSY